MAYRARAAHGEWRAGKKIFDAQLEHCIAKAIHGMLQLQGQYMECCKQSGRKFKNAKLQPRHAVKYFKEKFSAKNQGLKMLAALAVRKRKRIRRWRSLVCCDPFRKRIFKLRLK